MNNTIISTIEDDYFVFKVPVSNFKYYIENYCHDIEVMDMDGLLKAFAETFLEEEDIDVKFENNEAPIFGLMSSVFEETLENRGAKFVNI